MFGIIATAISAVVIAFLGLYSPARQAVLDTITLRKWIELRRRLPGIDAGGMIHGPPSHLTVKWIKNLSRCQLYVRGTDWKGWEEWQISDCISLHAGTEATLEARVGVPAMPESLHASASGRNSPRIAVLAEDIRGNKYRFTPPFHHPPERCGRWRLLRRPNWASWTGEPGPPSASYSPELHFAAKVDLLARSQTDDFEFVLLKMHGGKNLSWLGLHVRPTNPDSEDARAGLTLLACAGFRPYVCSYIDGGKCCAREVAADFSLDRFLLGWSNACRKLELALQQLQPCSVKPDVATATAFFKLAADPTMALFYTEGHRPPPIEIGPSGDGHGGPQWHEQQSREDDSFCYKLSAESAGANVRWVGHVHPKIASQSTLAALRFLGFRYRPQCPLFDFEPCCWHFAGHLDTPGVSDVSTEHLANQGSHVTANWLQCSTSLLTAVAAALAADEALRSIGFTLLRVVRDTSGNA